jgi:two-component system, OmpR family, response regulator
MPAPSLILVEDEADLCGFLCLYLEASGFDVRGVGDAGALDRVWRERPADILILDVNLPGEDGFKIAARLRATSPVGIIMMTARDTADDRITGFDVGADIYLVKPLLAEELLAAVRRLLARLGGRAEPAPPARPWSFDAANWSLTAPNGVGVALTTAERRLVELLMAAPGRPVPLADLLGPYGNADRNRLDVLLSRLRRKVESKTGLRLPIRAVRGEGYVFSTRTDQDGAGG